MQRLFEVLVCLWPRKHISERFCLRYLALLEKYTAWVDTFSAYELKYYYFHIGMLKSGDNIQKHVNNCGQMK